jgi:preprotein translocase subunit SecE
VAKAAGNSKTKKTSAADKRTSATRAKDKSGAKDKAVTKASAKRGAAGRSKPQARKGEKKGMRQFLRDVRVEMGKVTWPTRSDLVQSTWVVLVAVAIAATYIFVLDTVFSRGLSYITP